MQAIAAANNASWCDVVCRTHGIDTRFEADAWTSTTRTPPLYPDAVTLLPEASAPDVLARIDRGPGGSIKDSVAALDLHDDGFRVLFEAQWLVREPTTAPPPPGHGSWEVVRRPSDLAEWEDAWQGEADPVGSRRLFRPELLDDASVEVVAARAGGRIVSGAVLFRTGEVAGISNVFGDPSWSELVDLAPTATLVGYETGDALAGAIAQGFTPVGTLRVWTT